MPIKTKEQINKKIDVHILVCEDTDLYKRVGGRVAIVFSQKELIDLLDERLKELSRNLKELDMEKINARKRQIARTKLFGRIGEAEKIRKFITKSATFRKDGKYWHF